MENSLQKLLKKVSFIYSEILRQVKENKKAELKIFSNVDAILKEYASSGPLPNIPLHKMVKSFLDKNNYRYVYTAMLFFYEEDLSKKSFEEVEQDFKRLVEISANIFLENTNDKDNLSKIKTFLSTNSF